MIRKRIITLFFLLTFVSGVFVFSAQPAQAIIPGLPSIVVDPAHIAATTGNWIQNFANRLVDYGLKVALATLKKRLLDQIVDQTVKWIQNGEDPRFVTDTGDFFKQAGKEALGDLAQDLGAGFLCKPFQLSVRFALLTPAPFARKARCTLDDITKNLSGFYNNFQTGGWAGYQQLVRPNNNRWGVEIMAQDELFRKEQEKKEIAQNTLIAEQGFLSVKRCLEWGFVEIASQKVMTEGVQSIPNSSGVDYVTPPASPYRRFLDKKMPMKSPYTIPAEQIPEALVGIPVSAVQGKYQWKCMKHEAITPGQAVGEIAAKNLGVDIDYLLSAEDVSAYVAALTDALINRITKEATTGLKNAFKGDSPSNPPQGQSPQTNCNDLKATNPSTGLRTVPTPASLACEKYGSNQAAVKDQAVNNIRKVLNDAEKALTDATTGARTLFTNTQTANDKLITDLSDSDPSVSLIACSQVVGKTYTPSPQATLNDAQTKTRPAVAQKLADVNRLVTTITSLKSQVTVDSAVDAAFNQAVVDANSQSLSLRAEASDIFDRVNSALDTTQKNLLDCKNTVP